MASEVDICNLSLGHLGDDATVSSISPPEGSAQAQHCARFYPIARDALLEMHAWNFATRRETLAALTNVISEWQYAYAKPNNALRVLAVLPPGATSDYTAPPLPDNTVLQFGAVLSPTSNPIYQPKAFVVEVDASGNDVILTNQPTADARFTARITDTTRFSPLFVLDLSWLLASFLAGPVLKGDVGASEAQRCLQQVSVWHGRATTSDANQRQLDVQQAVPWMTDR